MSHPDAGPRGRGGPRSTAPTRPPAALVTAALIPALNEEVALPGLLSELRSTVVDRVVVVDNGSTDRTAGVAREGGAEVIVEPERGYGAACLAGISHLAEGETPPDVLVFLDGDQSDDPSAIGRLLEPIRAGRAEFVVGVRGAGADGEASAVPLHARLGNFVVLQAARLLHGMRFSDVGPFRAIRFETLQSLRMDDRNWGWTLQMQIRAHHLGVATEEVPVPHRPRAGGRSKVSGSLYGSVRAGAKMLFTLVRERSFRTRPRSGPHGGG